MNGTVERIRIFSSKVDKGKDLGEGRLTENLGLEGDFHAIGGERQISLLVAGEREQLTKQDEKGLCFSRFKENITIKRQAPFSEHAAQGTRLKMGEAVLEITAETKHCHEECELFESGKHCLLAGQNLFAKVVKSGVIRTGDRIDIAQ